MRIFANPFPWHFPRPFASSGCLPIDHLRALETAERQGDISDYPPKAVKFEVSEEAATISVKNGVMTGCLLGSNRSKLPGAKPLAARGDVWHKDNMILARGVAEFNTPLLKSRRLLRRSIQTEAEAISKSPALSPFMYSRELVES